ncbi:MAG TPA: hypothetical protein VE753_07855 [Gaiellaceae bacterium]|nr:hypothetical protein [Gaiellaceae bacterium]
MRALRFLALWLVALFGWWILLVGTNAGLELIAAGCAGFLAAFLALALRQQRQLRYRFELRWLAKTPKAPWKVLPELGIVLWALVLHLLRIRPVSSVYRALPFPTGTSDAVSAGRRALASLTDVVSPNTLPVDLDCERGVALRHELDPRRASKTLP